MNPPPATIRLAIVEDDAGFRHVLQRVFGEAGDFHLVAACGNGETALRQLRVSECDLVLMDINLPGISGVECLRQLKAMRSGLRVVMLTAFDDNDNLFQSLVAGADGYLLKRFARDRLLEAVRDIMTGGAPISPQIARRMVEYFHRLKDGGPVAAAPSTTSHAAEVASLTPREQEVLGLLAKGFTPKEVAAELNISWQTVRNFIKAIYEKLHVHTRTDAVLKYLGRSPETPNS
jgi:DNA-binding NarL/FixJ family response regulator